MKVSDQFVYISPRMAILKLSSQTLSQQILTRVQSYHKNYFHFFNLTDHSIPQPFQTHLKYRGIPFSLCQAFRLLYLIDKYLRKNIANAAIVCVDCPQKFQFASLVLHSYVNICCQNAFASTKHFSKQITAVYKNCRISRPPVKIIRAIKINKFIPIFQIHNEGRFNDFQLVYHHAIEAQLSQYYLTLDQPLKCGIGKKYYDCRPQTTFLKEIVVVCGDVKINVTSFETLSSKAQFTIGFNTLNLSKFYQNINGQQCLVLTNKDIYIQNQSRANQDLCIYIYFDNYCDNKKCDNETNCENCLEIGKKNSKSQTQIQIMLQQFIRDRSIQEVQKLI